MWTKLWGIETTWEWVLKVIKEKDRAALNENTPWSKPWETHSQAADAIMEEVRKWEEAEQKRKARDLVKIQELRKLLKQ